MMARLRVVNLGLPKSGTTTLGVALRASGLTVADWKIRRHQSTNPAVARHFVGDLMYRGYFETGDPLHLLGEFDAMTEINVVGGDLNRWPQTDWGLLSAIIDHHPDVKFILSHREPEAHADSMIRWTNLGRKRLRIFDVPGLPGKYGSAPADIVRWIDGHSRFCRRIFAGDPRFLEYDILDPEAPTKIGAFLGLPIQWWGTVNENPETGAETVTDAVTKPETTPTEDPAS
ncbi:sulfotransferase family protein [Ruegeria pomeroyi]|nr:sulfotransferase family protein [Ruegeria pomeroyi]